MILLKSGSIGCDMRAGKKRNRMKLWIRIYNGLEFRRLIALAAVSLAATFSSQAQFSVTLSSVQYLGGVAFDNGQPINYIYDFTISGNYPSNPDYTLYGISLYLGGLGYPGAIDGGFSASNVGGWIPTNLPEFQGDSVYF
jgi:hypothetical protein